MLPIYFLLSFFFNDTATTEMYTLSLHDALPIFAVGSLAAAAELVESVGVSTIASAVRDRHDWLADAIDDAGLDLLSPRDPARRAGIVVAGGPTERITAIQLRLADAGATVTAHGPDRIRFAPHATTPEDAIRRVAELLRPRLSSP